MRMLKSILISSLAITTLFLFSCDKGDKGKESAATTPAQPAAESAAPAPAQPAAESAAPAPAAAPAASLDGAQLFSELTCATCHGKEGKGMVTSKGRTLPGFENYPLLAGQNADYLFNQIKDIMAGKRTNGLTGTMVSDSNRQFFVDNGSDEKYRAIAKYLEGIK